MRKLTIAIDFDGCIASLNYPLVGKLMDCKEIINDWYTRHTIIINTCRMGKAFLDAYMFLEQHGIMFHEINENNHEIVNMYGNNPRKISADVYIDDKNAGGFRTWPVLAQDILKLEKSKPIIVCIVGESGSGKSTLAKKLIAYYGFNFIESYTDRERRGPDDDHTFLSKEQFDELKQEDMIAYTNFGTHRYCCLFKDVKEKNLYIIDEFGLNHLCEHHCDKYDIRTLRVTCSPGERVRRVGPDRVLRDVDKFNMPLHDFHYVISTEEEYDVSSLYQLMN